MNGFVAILLKEFTHIRRDRGTLIFALLVPCFQLIVFGYAIDVTIEHIPLVVFDNDGRSESRSLVDALINTETFQVVDRVHSLEEFRSAFESGWAKTGVIIPADYSERLIAREQATVQVLIDGSDSQVATTSMNTVNLLVTQLSIGRAKAVGERMHLSPAKTAAGDPSLAIEVRPRILYNPNLKSSFFFVPGLIAIILQLVLLFLTSFSIVRERELGTLEQLFVTPVGAGGLLLGKLFPYSALAAVEIFVVMILMTTLFGVPINGSLYLLLGLSLIFIVTVLGLGLLISTLAKTQLEAMQFSFVIMLPSILLSGFVFPRSEMPDVIYAFSFLIPVTYFIEILRGIILRGAGLAALLPYVLGLAACCVTVLILSLVRFHKQLD